MSRCPNSSASGAWCAQGLNIHVKLRELLTGPDVTVSSPEPGVLLVTGFSSEWIGQIAAEEGIALAELTPQQASLEEAFMELTRDAVEYQAPVAQGLGAGTEGHAA